MQVLKVITLTADTTMSTLPPIVLSTLAALVVCTIQGLKSMIGTNVEA